MSYQHIENIILKGSEMCFGEKNFSPYIPDSLQFGLEKGKYRLSYVSGAVRSHNIQRFLSFLPKQIIISSGDDTENICGRYYQVGKNIWNKDPSNSSNDLYIELQDGIYHLYKYQTQIFSFQQYQRIKTYKQIQYSIQVKTTYQNKWNKFYDLQYNLQNLSNYNFSILPDLRYGVFQCQFGTLPGFTPFGSNTIELAQYYGNGDLIPTQIYNSISSYILPLEFQLDETKNISFWYTDDCAPCVQGSITYSLDRYIENSQTIVNAFGVLSFNITTLQVQAPEYYQLNNVGNKINKEYIKQYTYLDINASNDYIKKLERFNTLGYYNNISTYSNSKNMNYSYSNSYNYKNQPDIYWQIKKIKSVNKVDLISYVGQTTSIPLFAGSYTVFPSNGKSLSGSIQTSEEYSLAGKEKFTFSIGKTTLVKFSDCSCYLYYGQIFQQDLLENYNQDEITIEKNSIQNNTEISQILQNINLINYDYYLYISPNNDYIQIISNTQQQKIIKESNFILGPFKNINDAQEEVEKYCTFNGLEFSKLGQNLFSIGELE